MNKIIMTRPTSFRYVFVIITTWSNLCMKIPGNGLLKFIKDGNKQHKDIFDILFIGKADNS